VKSGKYVAYYRVSTLKQGRSGLGLEAQERAVRGYLNGGDWQLVASFTETESGKRNDRPALTRALAAARLYGATLIVAKLDRLSRRAAFILNMIDDAGVDFEVVDLPNADRMTITIYAAVAEREGNAISERTKAALAAVRARGVRLGTPANLTPHARAVGSRLGAAATRAKAAQKARDLDPLLRAYVAAGTTSLRALAAELNREGIPSPRGGRWHAPSVANVLARIATP